MYVPISEMTTVLPRQFNAMKTVQLKFKRKLEYKTEYMAETFKPNHVLTALKLLLQEPLYQKYNVVYDEEAFAQYDPNNLETQANFIIDEADRKQYEDELLDNDEIN